jgi:hypothetical protein
VYKKHHYYFPKKKIPQLTPKIKKTLACVVAGKPIQEMLFFFSSFLQLIQFKKRP